MTGSEPNVRPNNSSSGSESLSLTLGPSENIDSTKDHDTDHLIVPSFSRPRRTSLDSAFSGSDLSELSFGSVVIGRARHEGPARVLSDGPLGSSHQPVQSAWRRKLQKFWTLNYGAALVLCSQFFGVGMNICTRMLETPGTHGEPMHPYQILFVRQSVTASACTVYALWSKAIPHFPLGPPGTVRWLLVIRGLCGFLGVFGKFDVNQDNK